MNSNKNHRLWRPRFVQGCVVLLLALAGLTLLDSRPAYAADITVNTTADELTTNGNCSLREAITNANSNAATWPDCAAGSGADVITLPAGTYVLTLTGAGEDFSATGDLDSRDVAGLTLAGAGAANTIIDGNGADRVLDVIIISGIGAGPLALQDLTIQNGNVTTGNGGGVLAGGTLTLTDTRLISNTASGVGGGVWANGAVTLNDGLFQGNTSSSLGGGLQTNGTLTMTGTQFISNTSSSFGGGVWAFGAVTLNGGLFQGNTGSRGGGLETNGAVTLTNTQFISNIASESGGGFFAFGAVTLNNGLFQENRASSTGIGGGLVANNTLVLTGTQIISNTAGGNGGGIAVGSATTLNGGLLQGNISGGEGGGIRAGGTLVLNGTQVLSNTASGTGGGMVANGVTLNGGLFEANTANGRGGGLQTNNTVTMTATRFISNTSGDNGGGAWAGGAVTLNGGLFQGNTGSRGGGLETNGAVTLTNTQFISNIASGSGGGLFAGGAVTLNNGLFQENRASSTGIGGGLVANNTLVLTGTQMISNTAGGNGGGIAVGSATTLNGGLLQGNTSGGEGGGLRAGGTLVLNGTQVLNNTSSGQGGGVFASNTLTASGVELLSNRASYGGGASANGAATLSDTIFQGNTCTAGGCFNPGLYAASHVTLSGVVTSTDDLDVAGNWTHNGVLNQTGSKVLMRGNAAQTIGGSQPVNFLSLDIRNASAAGVTLGSNITVTNQLNLVNDLTTTPAYRVNLPVGATTAGAGDVWGNTYRAHTFTAGTAYAYGNPNVTIKFDSGTPPTAMLVDLTKGAPTDFTSAVSRTYTITPTGGAGYQATLRLRYLDAELNGNTEAVLSLFRNDGTRWLKVGKSASDTGANWLEQSGVSVFSPWAISTFAPSNLLTITQPGNGSGAITSTPAGISCPTDCSELFTSGTVVTLTVTPQTGSQFAGWSGGGCSGTGACVITSTDDATISATFTLNQYQFSVTPPATGSGVITSTPAGISCPSDCSEPFDYGTVVTLTATPATGWSFTGWTGDCTGAGPCVITVGQPATVTPTFTLNQYPFSVTPPASGSGVITSTPAGISCPGDCSEPFGHGTVVTLTATPNPGWTFTGWTGDCTGTGACVVTVNGAKAVTPTFSLEKGSLTLVKKTEGGDGVFSFSSPQLGNFRLTTQKKTAQRTFADLTPGTYSASEIPTKGWDLTGATCSDGSNPAGINLAPGEQVTCNFTNVKRGSITVVKNSTGGDALFPFASQTLGGFDLTTVGGTAQRVFSNLVAGTYDLSENTLAGWTLTGATCSDGSSPASVSVAAGEEVTCTFTNVKQGSLTVVKQATGSNATFAFVSTALGAFDLPTVNGTASRTFANLNAGVYDVSETVPAGWRLDRATCSDGSTLPNVDVAAGEDVTCTFENSQLDTIVVIKLAIGGDDAFPFVSQALGGFVMTTTAGTAVQAFSGLVPGVYDVTESAVAGWNAAEADPACSNGNKASAITLGTGETVVCLFVNYKPDTIVVEKRTIGGDGAFGFTSNLPGAGSFSLSTVNGVASRAFNGLAPATYSISEQPQAGWAQTGASCSDGSDPSSINLAAGATVRCIFTDTKLSNITVVKTTTGGDGSFAFTGSLGSFSLSTAGGTAQRTFANILPGSYRISETVPSGWSLTGAGCADGSNPGNITLAAGRDLTCTFANTKQGNLAVVVNTTDGNGAFGFTSTALGDFSITTSGGTGQKSFANLAPGVYDLNEVVTSGWDLGAATCSNGSNPATVSVAAGETVSCIFENSAHSRNLYFPIIGKR